MKNLHVHGAAIGLLNTLTARVVTLCYFAAPVCVAAGPACTVLCGLSGRRNLDLGRATTDHHVGVRPLCPVEQPWPSYAPCLTSSIEAGLRNRSSVSRAVLFNLALVTTVT